MTTPFVQQINQLQKDLWPTVRDSVAAAKARRTTHSTPRLTFNETIWQVAKAGALRTGGEDRLVKAVREYLEDLEIADLDEYETLMLQALQQLDDEAEEAVS